MNNYPKMIKDLNISSRLNCIAREMDEKGFIIKGDKDAYSDKIHFTRSDNSIISYSTKEQSYDEYLKGKQESQLQMIEKRVIPSVVSNLKINNLFILGGSLVMVTSSLIGAHLFAGAFLYFIATSAVESYKLGKIKRQIKNDRWFLDNETNIEEQLIKNQNLLDELSNTSKTILSRDGKITLNNIDSFPKNDLRLVRRTISKENRKKVKILSK